MNAILNRPAVRASLCFLMLTGTLVSAETIRLDQFDVSQTSQDWGDPHRNASVEGHPLTIGGKHFEHGLGTHANSSLTIAVKGATKFTAPSVSMSKSTAGNPVWSKWSDLGITGKPRVRDLWRQKNIETFDRSSTAKITRHGVCLIRVK